MTREREMLCLRETEHLTLREIGERYNLTAERVRQILNRYRHSLRDLSAEHPPSLESGRKLVCANGVCMTKCRKDAGAKA